MIPSELLILSVCGILESEELIEKQERHVLWRGGVTCKTYQIYSIKRRKEMF